MAEIPSSPGPGRDLPPVAPPSGRFIAQLFLVPGLIVFFVVLLVIAINYMFVGGQSPDQFLIRIDSDNPDIRWRGANDLAQVLKRKESVALRSDVGFALDLCERLDKASKALETEEAAIGEAMQKDKALTPDKAFRRLEPQRNFVNFLASSLGDFNFPAGLPALGDVVLKSGSPDTISETQRRRSALWSLANMGQNMEEYKKLKPDHQALILAKLRNEVNSPSEVRRKAAKNALKALKEFPDGNDPDLVAVDQIIDASSKAQDQYLREISAFTLNFWDGPLAESILLRLTNDTGFGTLVKNPVES